jgi:hypothetical protein
MTFQPPPPPPGGNPPPPPPPGQWGPPPGGGSPSSQGGFDPKNVNPLDWGIVGAGVIAFFFSFIDFYDGADVEAGGRSATVDTGAYSAWHDVIGGGFWSWFAMVFAILGAVAVAMSLFAPQVKLPLPNRLAGLALFAAAALFEIIGIFVTPGDSSSFGSSDVDVSLNHGFGFWISLIAILAGLVLSLMRLQQTGGKLPGALANMPNIGAKGPQGGMGGGQPGPGGPQGGTGGGMQGPGIGGPGGMGNPGGPAGPAAPPPPPAGYGPPPQP